MMHFRQNAVKTHCFTHEGHESNESNSRFRRSTNNWMPEVASARSMMQVRVLTRQAEVTELRAMAPTA